MAIDAFTFLVKPPLFNTKSTIMKWQVRSAAPYSRMNDVIYRFSLALFLRLSMANRLVSHPAVQYSYTSSQKDVDTPLCCITLMLVRRSFTISTTDSATDLVLAAFQKLLIRVHVRG